MCSNLTKRNFGIQSGKCHSVNELNNLYILFETIKLFLRNVVICNVCDNRTLIDPNTVTKVLKTIHTVQQKHVCFSLKDIQSFSAHIDELWKKTL